MLRKEQRAASGEGKTARKFQSNCHMITVGGKWAVTGRSGQIRPAPYSKTTGHFHSDSLTSPMTEQKENGQPALQDILMLLHPLPQRLQLLGSCLGRVLEHDHLSHPDQVFVFDGVDLHQGVHGGSVLGGDL